MTVWLGALAGQLIRRGSSDRSRTAGRLALTGGALVLAGLLWSLEMPIIKRLWTASMALYSGGLCFLLMALSYWWIDVRGHVKGWGWLKIYGMNSLMAYLIGETVNFRSAVESLSYGLQPLLGDFYGAWLTLGNYSIVFLILWAMHRMGCYVKI